ncbi:MAG: CU044_5270 family protein, partial [Nakamurella sp.]
DVPVNPAAAPAAYARLMSAVAALPDSDHRFAPAAPLDSAAALGAMGEAGVTHPRRERWRRDLVAVAAVAVLIGVGLLAPTLWTRNNRPAVSADAAQLLTRAASAITSSDEPVGPGQFQYIDTHAWWAVFDRSDVYLVENRISVWVPADPSDPSQLWMLDRAPTGNTQWVSGDQDAFNAAGGVRPGIYPTLHVTAACGDFYAENGCGRAGSWQDPTPAFLTELPRDPVQLYDRLQADAPDNGRGDAELFVYSADLLRSGLVPADLRAALYETLATLPGLEITDAAANLDGRVGTALGIDDGHERQDIIIDPATGAFIGERQVLTDDQDGVPAGSTISFTSVTRNVVDALGARPRR